MILLVAIFVKMSHFDFWRKFSVAVFFSGFNLHLAGEHKAQVVFRVHRQVFDQASPKGLAEVRHLVGQAFQRRDEPLEFPPADAALPDFGSKGVPIRLGDMTAYRLQAPPPTAGNSTEHHFISGFISTIPAFSNASSVPQRSQTVMVAYRLRA